MTVMRFLMTRVKNVKIDEFSSKIRMFQKKKKEDDYNICSHLESISNEQQKLTFFNFLQRSIQSLPSCLLQPLFYMSRNLKYYNQNTFLNHPIKKKKKKNSMQIAALLIKQKVSPFQICKWTSPQASKQKP